MKQILFISILSLGWTAGATEWCNWGFAAPKSFTCAGEHYVYGTAACNSGIYSHIFCNEKLMDNGKDCSTDESPATMECYHKMMGEGSASRTTSQPKKSEPHSQGWCNWGFVPPATYSCGGKTYVYGTAACTTGLYSKIFCPEELMDDGKACSEDESQATVDCLRKAKEGQIQPNPSSIDPAYRSKGVR